MSLFTDNNHQFFSYLLLHKNYPLDVKGITVKDFFKKNPWFGGVKMFEVKNLFFLLSKKLYSKKRKLYRQSSDQPACRVDSCKLTEQLSGHGFRDTLYLKLRRAVQSNSLFWLGREYDISGGRRRRRCSQRRLGRSLKG